MLQALANWLPINRSLFRPFVDHFLSICLGLSSLLIRASEAIDANYLTGVHLGSRFLSFPSFQASLSDRPRTANANTQINNLIRSCPPKSFSTSLLSAPENFLETLQIDWRSSSVWINPLRQPVTSRWSNQMKWCFDVLVCVLTNSMKLLHLKS